MIRLAITDIDQDAVAVVEGSAAVADTGCDVSDPAGVDQSYAALAGEHGHHISRSDAPARWRSEVGLVVHPRPVDTTDAVMPAAFLGHGNPMNALAVNRYTTAWHSLGTTVPRPRAILVISAHWYVNATAVTAMPRPRTIHDFYGSRPSSSTSTTPLRGSQSSPTRSATSCTRPGSVPMSIAGVSTTAPGRCCCTRSRAPVPVTRA